MIESLGPWGVFLTAVAGVLTALGAADLIKRAVTRRGDRADAVRAENKEVATVNAAGNLEVLKVLLTETKDRVDGYERAIAELKASHSADIRELKVENRELERQVNDLRIALQDYQLGNRVPRGMVLVPVHEIKAIRELHPGLLQQRWYPGELEAVGTPPPGGGLGEEEGPSIHARITRLPPGSP